MLKCQLLPSRVLQARWAPTLGFTEADCRGAPDLPLAGSTVRLDFSEGQMGPLL